MTGKELRAAFDMVFQPCDNIAQITQEDIRQIKSRFEGAAIRVEYALYKENKTLTHETTVVAVTSPSTALKFFWNGIKDSTGKLQKCLYSGSEGPLTIYGKCRFSAEVREVFTVENNSDSMTDYFEDDRIRVLPDHPLYAQVKAASLARQARYTDKIVR